MGGATATTVAGYIMEIRHGPQFVPNSLVVDTSRANFLDIPSRTLARVARTFIASFCSTAAGTVEFHAFGVRDPFGGRSIGDPLMP